MGASVGGHDLAHVEFGFAILGNGSVDDGARPGVVGGHGQANVVETGELRGQVAAATVDGFCWIEGSDTPSNLAVGGVSSLGPMAPADEMR